MKGWYASSLSTLPSPYPYVVGFFWNETSLRFGQYLPMCFVGVCSLVAYGASQLRLLMAVGSVALLHNDDDVSLVAPTLNLVVPLFLLM